MTWLDFEGQKLRSKQAVECRGGEGIHVDAGASKSIL